MHAWMHNAACVGVWFIAQIHHKLLTRFRDEIHVRDAKHRRRRSRHLRL